MKKADILKTLEAAQDADEFVFRSSTDDQKYLENFKTAEVQKAIDEGYSRKLSEFANHFDEAVLEVTGKRKEGTKKSSEFVKEVLADLKSKADKATELEEKIKQGKGSEAVVAELESVKGEYKKLKKQFDESDANWKTREKSYRVRSELNQAMAGMTFNDSMSEEVRRVFIDTVVSGLIGSADFEGERLFFKAADGTVLKNPANLEALTPAELLTEKLKPVLKESKTGKGAGGGSGAGGSGVSFVLPDYVKTKEKLSEELAKQGKMRGTKEYNEIYDKYAPGLPFE